MLGTSRRDRRGTVRGIDKDLVFDLVIRFIQVGLGSLHCIIGEIHFILVSGQRGCRQNSHCRANQRA
jgi:hypothetical protein